jgi:hypothetical protein
LDIARENRPEVWVARPDRLDLPCGVPTANSSDEGVGSYVSGWDDDEDGDSRIADGHPSESSMVGLS